MFELLLVSCGFIVSTQGCIIAARDIADFTVVCFVLNCCLLPCLCTGLLLAVVDCLAKFVLLGRVDSQLSLVIILICCIILFGNPSNVFKLPRCEVLTLMQAQQGAMKRGTTSVGVILLRCCDVEKVIKMTTGWYILPAIR